MASSSSTDRPSPGPSRAERSPDGPAAGDALVRALLDPALAGHLASQVVGRRRQLEVVAAALAAGRHVLLEGPPGTGKSTLLGALAHAAGVGFALVEGSAELTPARLVGHHDPSRVLAEGYREEIFVDGPLTAAVRDGTILYVEEINRVPEETLNVLVTVMSDGALHVPRLGRIEAAPGFRLVAAMNPFDAVGTARISSAIYDRTCRVSMDYQSAADEEEIVRRRTGPSSPPAGDEWLGQVVEVVRRTRRHPDIRVGSSVRGAIDLVLVARSLAAIRDSHPEDARVGLDAALAALSGRIRVLEGTPRTPEDLVTSLWTEVFGPVAPGTDGPGSKSDAEPDEAEALSGGHPGTAAPPGTDAGKGPAPAGRAAGA